jgi:hypothetical protein
LWPILFSNRRFTIEEWQLNQGRISVQIDFSDQKGGLDGG